MESMANNVLSDEDAAWVESKRETILRMASGNFAGEISIEDRGNYHRIAQHLIGFGFLVCWTCGSGIQTIGAYIKNSLQWH
jgi:hypothetical protein